MKYNFFFDYIFYRITKTYFKWDGRTGATGIAAVSLIQIFLIFDLLVLLSRIFFEKNYFKPYITEVKISFIIIIVLFLFMNYRKYSSNYNQLRSYWKNETERASTIKGLLITFVFSFPIVLFLIINYLTLNSIFTK